MSQTTCSWTYLLSPLWWPQHPLPLKFLWTPVLTTVSSALPLSAGPASPQSNTFSELKGTITSFTSDRSQECPLWELHQVYKLPPSRNHCSRPHPDLRTSCSKLVFIMVPVHPCQLLPAPWLSGVRGPSGRHSRSGIQFPVSADALVVHSLKK